eukprot:2783138-Karenia_brevis.AAC.1
MFKQKVAPKHPAWGDALDSGLKWTVLHRDLPKIYPGLCNLIQRARNAVSQTHSPESIIELILEIFTLAKDMEAATGNPPDWHHVEKTVMQSEPPNSQQIGIVCAAHSEILLKDYVYTCAPADREINGDIIAAVSERPA